MLPRGRLHFQRPLARRGGNGVEYRPVERGRIQSLLHQRCLGRSDIERRAPEEVRNWITSRDRLAES